MRTFSDGMIRLHKLCDVFTKVAMPYVRAKTNEAAFETSMSSGVIANDNTSSGNFGQYAVDDIDEYLSSIGFGPPANQTTGLAEGVNDLPDLDPI